MTIIIVVACVVVAFFIYPVQTIEWLGEKAKSRAKVWASLFSKEVKKEDNK
jgi:hypothetical protein